MNPLSAFWLSRRQAKARALIHSSTVLDIGSRTEKLREDEVTLDIERSVRPDICASAEALPFRDGSFDYIVMLEVIEHLNDAQLHSALRECKRVAHSAIFSTPNCDSAIWDKVVWPLWSHTIGREWIGAHKQFFGKASLAKLLEGTHGMKILERNYSHWNLLVLVSTRAGGPSGLAGAPPVA